MSERIPDIVPVPDLAPPTAILCWRQDPASAWRCDRRRDHGGMHTWQSTDIIEGLKRAIRDAIERATA